MCSYNKEINRKITRPTQSSMNAVAFTLPLVSDVQTTVQHSTKHYLTTQELVVKGIVVH